MDVYWFNLILVAFLSGGIGYWQCNRLWQRRLYMMMRGKMGIALAAAADNDTGNVNKP